MLQRFGGRTIRAFRTFTLTTAAIAFLLTVPQPSLADIVPNAGNLAIHNLSRLVGGECTSEGERLVYHFKPVDLSIFTKIVHNADCTVDVYARDGLAYTPSVGYIYAHYRWDHTGGFGLYPNDYTHSADFTWNAAYTCPNGYPGADSTNPVFDADLVQNACVSSPWGQGEMRRTSFTWQDNWQDPQILMQSWVSASVDGYAACHKEPVDGVWNPTLDESLGMFFYCYFGANIDPDDIEVGPWTGIAFDVLPGETREIDIPGR